MQLLSVVVPVYNSEETIERCIKSIIRQTYDKLEIMIVDDGSTDQSYEISKRLADNDTRIKVLKREHLGVMPARKAGVSQASGEYIAFVDSDDWIEDTYFEYMMEDIEGIDVVITEHYVVEQNERQKDDIFQRHIEEGVYSGNGMKEVLQKAVSPNGIDCCLWNRVCRTSFVKSSVNRIPDAVYLMEDYAISVQVLLMADKVRICTKGGGGYHYHINNGSLVHSTHKDYLYNLHLIYTCMAEILESHVYGEQLKHCFAQYMRYLISRSPYYLELKNDREEENLQIYYTNLYFPYYGRLKNMRLVLYGAGYVGKAYYYHIINDKEAELAAWADKAFYKFKDFPHDIISPDEIKNIAFDYIIVAVWDEKAAVEIRKELVRKGISEEVILWNRTRKMHLEL